MHDLRERERESVIALESLLNFRDLGSYPVEGGSQTRQGLFYRAPGLHGMSVRDYDYLFGLGIRSVIDLRSPREVAAAPDPFGRGDGVSVYHVSIMGDDPVELTCGTPLDKLYIHYLATKSHLLRQVFAIMAARVDEGACVFHCSAGKDRTGVVAALLLSLVGVGDTDVVANYAATEVLMKPLLDQWRLVPPDDGRTAIPDNHFGSDAGHMEAFLHYLHARYGSAESYFRGTGLSEAEVRRLRGAFVEGCR